MKIPITHVTHKSVDLPYLNYNSLLIAYASSHVIDSSGNEVGNLDLLEIISKADPGETLFPNWTYGHSVLEYLFEPDAFYSVSDAVRIAAFDLIMETRPEEADYSLEHVLDFGGELMNHILTNYKHVYIKDDNTFIDNFLQTITDSGNGLTVDVVTGDILSDRLLYKSALNNVDLETLGKFVDIIEDKASAFELLTEALTLPCGGLSCKCVFDQIQEYITSPELVSGIKGYIAAGIATGISI